MKDNTITRYVMESIDRDLERCIIRIDYDTMDELKIRVGSAVKINNGNNSIVSKCLPLYPSDENKKLIRINKADREMLDVDVSDPVQIISTKLNSAEKITVRPVTLFPKINTDVLLKNIIGTPVRKNITIPTSGLQSTPNTQRIQIVDTEPAGNVEIRENTTIIFDNIFNEVLHLIETILFFPDILIKLRLSKVPAGIKIHCGKGFDVKSCLKEIAIMLDVGFISDDDPDYMPKVIERDRLCVFCCTDDIFTRIRKDLKPNTLPVIVQETDAKISTFSTIDQ